VRQKQALAKKLIGTAKTYKQPPHICELSTRDRAVNNIKRACWVNPFWDRVRQKQPQNKKLFGAANNIKRSFQTKPFM